jgi:hypothetical protein
VLNELKRPINKKFLSGSFDADDRVITKSGRNGAPSGTPDQNECDAARGCGA